MNTDYSLKYDYEHIYNPMQQIQNIQLCNIFYFLLINCTNVYLFDLKFILFIYIIFIINLYLFILFILYKFLFILLKNFLYDRLIFINKYY